MCRSLRAQEDVTCARNQNAPRRGKGADRCALANDGDHAAVTIDQPLRIRPPSPLASIAWFVRHTAGNELPTRIWHGWQSRSTDDERSLPFIRAPALPSVLFDALQSPLGRLFPVGCLSGWPASRRRSPIQSTVILRHCGSGGNHEGGDHRQRRFSTASSGTGKGIVGKGISGKGISGKGISGKGISGKGIQSPFRPYSLALHSPAHSLVRRGDSAYGRAYERENSQRR